MKDFLTWFGSAMAAGIAGGIIGGILLSMHVDRLWAGSISGALGVGLFHWLIQSKKEDKS